MIAKLVATLLVLSAAPSRAPRHDSPERSTSVYELVSPTVVTISVVGRDGKEMARGSGVVIRSDGTILTNYHVVEGGTFFDVRVPGLRNTLPARALGCDPDQDLAVLHVTHSHPLRAAHFGKRLPPVGTRVLAVGSPLLLEGTLTEGIVSQIREDGERRLIQTTAAISPGSSGGGLFLSSGELVGITTMTIRGGQALNFAVAVSGVSTATPCSEFAVVRSPREEEEETVQPTPTPTPTLCPAHVALVEGAADAGRFSYPVAEIAVNGIVENRGCRPARSVKVNSMMRFQGRLLDTCSAYVTDLVIRPGSRSTFKCYMTIPDYLLQGTYSPAQLSRELKFTSEVASYEED